MTPKKKPKYIPLETRLESLISIWAKNSSSLVPKRRRHGKADIRIMLNELVEAYEKVDDLISEYESVKEDNKSLEERYPSREVYLAGITCCIELNARWDGLYAKAKKEGALDDYQINVTDINLARIAEYHRNRNLPKKLE